MDYMNQLPDEILDRIFQHLQSTDLISLGLVCHRFLNLSLGERHWKSLCEIDWDISALPEDQSSWKSAYASMFDRFGRYVKCYRRVNRCWKEIYAVTRDRAPVLHASLYRNGTTDEVLDNVERSLGEHTRLPPEYRCSYRLCNGQMNPRPAESHDWSFAGLFGSYDDQDHGDFMCTLSDDYPMRTQTPNCSHIDPLTIRYCCLSLVFLVKRSIPAMITHGGVALCIRDLPSSPKRAACTRDALHQRLDGCMVSSGSPRPDGLEFFVYNNSLVEYLETFVKKAAVYPVTNNRFLKFDFNSEGETGPFKVTTRTALFRERSTALPVEDREFHFFYRITISMRPDALRRDSCQLETRHWVITDDNGKVNHVDGPGVVGNYPIMRPGAEFSWISRTSYSTIRGTMHGHFKMRGLNAEAAEIRIECPPYVMNAPEIVGA